MSETERRAMSPVKGICGQMCPKEEITMRKTRKLVHQLEQHPKKMVKSFSRSAAGNTLNKPHLLRPPTVLKNTVSYLLNDVLTVANVPFNVVYDFINDRLKAVRQDATIQEVSHQDWLAILPPIIRFYAYAAYKCSTYDVNTFDPVLNKNSFHECIFKILNILEEESADENRLQTDELCSEMVSLLVVANLGDNNVLQKVLPFLLKKSTLIKRAVLLSVNIMNGDFGWLLKAYNEFPTIHQYAIRIQLPTLRKYILKSMCLGFNCKNNYFPVSLLTKLLLHNSEKDTKEECKHYCILVIDDKVELSKSSFNNEVDEFHLKKILELNVLVSSMILNVNE